MTCEACKKLSQCMRAQVKLLIYTSCDNIYTLCNNVCMEINTLWQFMPERSYWSKSSIGTIAPLKVIWGNALRECIALKLHTERNGKWPMAHCVQCKAPIFWSIFEMPQLLTGTPDLRSWRCREPERSSHTSFFTTLNNSVTVKSLW